MLKFGISRNSQKSSEYEGDKWVANLNNILWRILMLDMEFRAGLRKVLEENPTNDAAVIQYVLEHAWEQYPRPFFIWLNRKIRAYDQFK